MISSPVRTGGSRSKFLAGVVILVAAMAAAASPVHATASPPPASTEVVIDGTLTGTGGFTDPACSGEASTIVEDGTVSLAGFGAATFHLLYCLEIPGPEFGVVNEGEFSVDSGAGSFSGTVTGIVWNQMAEQGFLTELTLTADAGTGAFESAHGTIELEAYSGLGGFTIDGTLAGTLTVEAPPAVNLPTRTRDCKRGGWAEHTDEHGVPFPNRRVCIRWVREHLAS